MLTLRGKRIGLTLQEIRELFELYDTANDDESQLFEFIKLLSRAKASCVSSGRHQCGAQGSRLLGCSASVC